MTYGTVYYKTNPSDTTVQKVEITSLAEFNSLVGTSSSSAFRTVINGVTLNGQGANVVVGLEIGPQITSIPDYFLKSCVYLNQPLVLPSGVTSIGQYFLSGCSSFNQPLTLPSSLSSIGRNFLSTCTSFNQPLVLPSGVTSIGTTFMYNCNAMTSYVNVGSLAATIMSTSNYAFSTTNSTAGSYTTGVKIKGTNRAAWLSRFPNRTSSPYRKLVDYGS